MKLIGKLMALSFLLLTFTMAGFASAGELDGITFLTENSPPLNFEKDGKVSGIAVDLLDVILKKTGANATVADVQLLPWANGYKQVQDTPDTCLFSMARTEERETLFKWAGPIMPLRVVVLAKKGGNVSITSAADLGKYTYGVVRDDVGMQLLQGAGVPEANLDITSDNEANAKKLEAGRVDAWAFIETAAMATIKETGLDPANYEVAYVLKELPLCYAFNKNTADAKVDAFQKALDAVKAEGAVDKIIAQYVK